MHSRLHVLCAFLLLFKPCFVSGQMDLDDLFAVNNVQQERGPQVCTAEQIEDLKVFIGESLQMVRAAQEVSQSSSSAAQKMFEVFLKTSKRDRAEISKIQCMYLSHRKVGQSH